MSSKTEKIVFSKKEEKEKILKTLKNMKQTTTNINRLRSSKYSRTTHQSPKSRIINPINFTSYRRNSPNIKKILQKINTPKFHTGKKLQTLKRKREIVMSKYKKTYKSSVTKFNNSASSNMRGSTSRNGNDRSKNSKKKM